MIRLLKVVAFAAAVLLLGQVSVGSKTVAEHFRSAVKGAAEAAKEEISKSNLVAGLSRHMQLPGSGASGSPRVADDEESEPEAAPSHDDRVSSADRESLLRVLQ